MIHHSKKLLTTSWSGWGVASHAIGSDVAKFPTCAIWLVFASLNAFSSASNLAFWLRKFRGCQGFWFRKLCDQATPVPFGLYVSPVSLALLVSLRMPGQRQFLIIAFQVARSSYVKAGRRITSRRSDLKFSTWQIWGQGSRDRVFIPQLTIKNTTGWLFGSHASG